MGAAKAGSANAMVQDGNNTAARPTPPKGNLHFAGTMLVVAVIFGFGIGREVGDDFMMTVFGILALAALALAARIIDSHLRYGRKLEASAA